MIVWGLSQSCWAMFHLFGPTGAARPLTVALGATVSAAAYLFVRCLPPAANAGVGIGDAGLRLPAAAGRPARLIPWNLVSDATCVEDAEAGWYIVLRLKALVYRLPFPLSRERAERLREAIDAKITDDGRRTDRLSVAEFFRLFFDVTLPTTASAVGAEYHPEEPSGLWTLKLTREERDALFTRRGMISAWYPLTRDQRFRVGGRPLIGGADIAGDYAIATGDFPSTPVLVWDRQAGLLHAILTSSMG